jgi:hypothetical protein
MFVFVWWTAFSLTPPTMVSKKTKNPQKDEDAFSASLRRYKPDQVRGVGENITLSATHLMLRLPQQICFYAIAQFDFVKI